MRDLQTLKIFSIPCKLRQDEALSERIWTQISVDNVNSHGCDRVWITGRQLNLHQKSKQEEVLGVQSTPSTSSWKTPLSKLSMVAEWKSWKPTLNKDVYLKPWVSVTLAVSTQTVPWTNRCISTCGRSCSNFFENMYWSMLYSSWEAMPQNMAIAKPMMITCWSSANGFATSVVSKCVQILPECKLGHWPPTNCILMWSVFLNWLNTGSNSSWNCLPICQVPNHHQGPHQRDVTRKVQDRDSRSEPVCLKREGTTPIMCGPKMVWTFVSWLCHIFYDWYWISY